MLFTACPKTAMTLARRLMHLRQLPGSHLLGLTSCQRAVPRQHLKDFVLDDECPLCLSLCEGPGRLNPVLKVHLFHKMPVSSGNIFKRLAVLQQPEGPQRVGVRKEYPLCIMHKHGQLGQRLVTLTAAAHPTQVPPVGKAYPPVVNRSCAAPTPQAAPRHC